MRDYREVRIPIGNEKQFEEFVAQLGGEIRRKPPLLEKEDPEVLWRQELTLARAIIPGLIQQHDPKQQEEVHKGIRSLIGNNYPTYFGNSREVREDLDYIGILSLLSSFFADHLPEDENMPRGVIWRKTRRGIHFVRTYEPSEVLPQDVIFLVERYGLINGERISKAEIASRYNSSTLNVSDRIKSASWTIFGNPQMRQLVLVNP